MSFWDKHPLLEAVVAGLIVVGATVLFVGLLLMAWYMIEIGCGGFCP